MFYRTTRTYSLGMFLLGFLLICSVQSALAQSTSAPASSGGIANGQKVRINGVVVKSEQGQMTVRDPAGAETVVLIGSDTSMRPRSNNVCNRVCPGRCVKVEGRGNCDGNLVAEEIKFRRDDCNVCFFSEQIEAIKEEQAHLAADHLALSGRVDQNAAAAREARAAAQAAQQSADAAASAAAAANAGVRANTDRLSQLDTWEAKEAAVVNFRTSKSNLNSADKAVLDAFAAKATSSKGYMITIAGFTDSTGREGYNNALSNRRADAVARYLVSNGNIPLGRIQIIYGGGETTPVASNDTRPGRAENRRATATMLVNPVLAGETLTQTSTDH